MFLLHPKMTVLLNKRYNFVLTLRSEMSSSSPSWLVNKPKHNDLRFPTLMWKNLDRAVHVHLQFHYCGFNGHSVKPCQGAPFQWETIFKNECERDWGRHLCWPQTYICICICVYSTHLLSNDQILSASSSKRKESICWHKNSYMNA